VCAVLLIAVAAGACLASKADELLADADKELAKAKVARNTADRNEYYKQAVKTYNEVAGQSRYAGTPQAARAMFQVAVIQSTAKGKSGNLYGSYETLKRLINTFDKPERELSADLVATDVREVQRIVVEAKQLKEAVSVKLDKENSGKLQYKVMEFLVNLTGKSPGFSYWFAIILLTIIVKVIITPLTHAQFKAMKEMQKISPLIKKIQEEHRGDQKTIGEKTMDLYREHHINPFASCLPLLIQMPILMLLYYTIRSYEFQFAKGGFLWIGSGLSHNAHFAVPFQQGSLVWFTAANLAEPDLILVVLYVISMFVSTKLSAVDPSQADQQKIMSIMMPVMFAFIFAGFPAAFLLYWLVFNILQTVQQYFILKPAQAVEVLPAQSEPPTDDDGGEQRIRRRRRR